MARRRPTTARTETAGRPFPHPPAMPSERGFGRSSAGLSRRMRDLRRAVSSDICFRHRAVASGMPFCGEAVLPPAAVSALLSPRLQG